MNINIGSGWFCVTSIGAKAAESLAPKLHIPNTDVDTLVSNSLDYEMYMV